MHLGLVLVGFLSLWFGLLAVAHPRNGVVRTLVDPRTWQRDPVRAARLQARRVRHAGLGLGAVGLCLVVVGFVC